MELQLNVSPPAACPSWSPVTLCWELPCFTRNVAGWCQLAARKQDRESHNGLGFVCESVEEGKKVRKTVKSSVKAHFELLC